MILAAEASPALSPTWLSVLAPAGVVLAAVISGVILLRSHRAKSHEALREYLEVWNALPEGDAKDRLLDQIESRVIELSTPRASWTSRYYYASIQTELGGGATRGEKIAATGGPLLFLAFVGLFAYAVAVPEQQWPITAATWCFVGSFAWVVLGFARSIEFREIAKSIFEAIASTPRIWSRRAHRRIDRWRHSR